MKTRKSTIVILLIVTTCILFFVGCLPGENPSVDSSYSSAGFFTGIWQGLISPFSLIASIFFDVSFYEVDNTGWWYNLGFLIGIGSLFFGLGASSNN